MRVIVLVLLSLILVLDAKALAVASDYLPGGVLELTEESSTIYSIRLQNTESKESKVKVTYTDTYLKGINFKEEYTLPPKSSTRIEFNVTAPKYNKDNNIFDMSYTVHQLSGAGGGIGFLSKINKNIKLKVIEDPNKFHINYFYVAYAIVLLIIIFLLLKRKI